MNRPELSRAKLERTRALMNTEVEDSLVEGYEGLIEALTLPDADDRHVMAAAIKARASIIVTYNLSDFPTSILAPYNMKAQHPDVFTSQLLVAEPDEFLNVIHQLLAALKNPPKTFEEFIETLRINRLTTTADRLAAYKSEF